MLLSIGSPLGWLLLRTVAGYSPLEDIVNHPWVYLYMTLGTAIAFASFGAYVGYSEQRLSKLTLTDALTGAYNNRFFQQHYLSEFHQSRRANTPLSLIVLDFDHFKQVNDTYGHLAGDEVLRQICDSIKQQCREGEVLARVGGEEFAIILSNCNKEQAIQAGERLRNAIAITDIPVDTKNTIRITASLGLACSLTTAGDHLALYAAADRAMYQAKLQGRNCVVAA